MLRIEFSPEEIEALAYERYNHSHQKVQKKLRRLMKPYEERDWKIFGD